MTESKVAVITGAGSGIGRGLAQFAASKKMQLVLCDVNAGGLDETLDIVTAEGVEAIARAVDVSDINAMMNLAGETYATFGACHYLFNNAGVLGPAPVKDVTREMYDWLMDINMGGCFNGVNAFLPRMLESGEEGNIVATCSTSGFISYPMLSLYSASKFAIRGFMATLREELKTSKIQASIVCPGCLLYTSPSPRDAHESRMPSSA